MNHSSVTLSRLLGRLSLFLRYISKISIEGVALITQKKFLCRSLQGEPHYGLSVNSDLTVSCNCSDYSGQSQIGDLATQSWKDILSSEKVLSFKQKLASGRLPIIECAACQERRVARDKIDIGQFRLPRHLIVENTIACNLGCLSCDRREIYARRKKDHLSLEEIESLAKNFCDIGVDTIFYFKNGEPFASPDIKEELTIIKRHNPRARILISTNGMLIDTKDKMEAALLCDHIFVSLDGADQETVERYQRRADFETAYHTMKELAAQRGAQGKPFLEWKYVLFRWNDRPAMLDKAIALAREARVDMLSFWKTTSPIYALSYRYYLGFKYFRSLGRPSWKGREVDLREKSFSCPGDPTGESPS